MHQLLARAHVIEDFLLEDEEATVDGETGAGGVLEHTHGAVVVQVHVVEGELRFDAEKARSFVGLAEELDHLAQRRVRQTIRIIRQKQIVGAQIIQVFFHRLQPHADVGGEPGVREGDLPVVNIGLEQLRLAVFQHKVVGQRFVVIQEVVLDDMGVMAQAQNEFLVAMMGVVLHQVPQNGAMADRHHGLGNVVGIFPQPHAETTTKQYHFHDRFLVVLNRTFNQISSWRTQRTRTNSLTSRHRKALRQ